MPRRNHGSLLGHPAAEQCSRPVAASSQPHRFAVLRLRRASTPTMPMTASIVSNPPNGEPQSIFQGRICRHPVLDGIVKICVSGEKGGSSVGYWCEKMAKSIRSTDARPSRARWRRTDGRAARGAFRGARLARHYRAVARERGVIR